MKIRPFNTYESYVRMQEITDRKKSDRTSVTEQDVDQIVDWFVKNGIKVKRVLCHGARNGQEVDWFAAKFWASAWGTDILPRDHPRVLKWDFHEQGNRWRGNFDLVYSNSLDHAHDPELAVRTWIDQLTSGGKLCVQWSHWSTRAVMGDCFGAQFEDYLMLLNHVGKVYDVIYHRGTVVTIVTGRKS